jgi:hypothetical protein
LSRSIGERQKVIVKKGDSDVKKGLSFLVVAVVMMLMVSGCGYPTSLNVKDLSMNGGQLTSVKLTRKGKTGTTYTLSGKSAAPKGGQAKLAFALDTEKGKEKVEVVFDLPAGTAVSFNQKLTPKGKIKSVTSSAFTYKPYEFTVKDYPTEPGLEYVYYSGKPTSAYDRPAPFPVNFNLTGPWDFSQGPTDGQLVDDSIAPKDTRDNADFPGANKAVKESSGDSSETRFYKVDEASSQELGRSTTTLLTAAPYITTFSPPVIDYKFPFKVGDEWNSSSELLSSGAYSGKGSYALTNKVISKNSIVVPQGKYDVCYLIQTRANILDSDGSTWNTIGYSWVVPNVGSVAHIESANGEQAEVFSQGTVFTRLKYKGQKKPGL